jgi:dTDP-L-rhamnose 4-epimerase
VGTGVATNVITVAESLIKNYGIQIPLEISGQYRKGDIRHNFADITLIKEKLGFVPNVDFESGLQLFCDWVNQQSPAEDKYEQSLSELRSKGLMK